MAGIRTPQNPGIGGLDELTDAEEVFLTTFAGLSASEGNVLSFVSGAPAWSSTISVTDGFFTMFSGDFTQEFKIDGSRGLDEISITGVVDKFVIDIESPAGGNDIEFKVDGSSMLLIDSSGVFDEIGGVKFISLGDRLQTEDVNPKQNNLFDLGHSKLSWQNTYSSTLRTGEVNTNTTLFQARDVDGASWTTFATLTAGDTPTMSLESAVTGTTQSASDNSTKLATTAYVDAASVVSARKTSNETINNDDTLTADTDLSVILVADTNYIVTGMLIFQTSEVADFKYSLLGPSGGFSHVGFGGGRDNTTVSTEYDISNAFGEVDDALVLSSTKHLLWINGVIGMGASPSTTTVAIAWSQNTSDAVDTTLFANSYIRFEIIT